MTRVTAADILKVVPITRKTLWLWQKKYCFFPNPVKEGHPGGKGIVGYYPAWVEERCKKVYALQKKGYTILMIKDILEKEEQEKSTRKILIVDKERKFCDLLKKIFQKNDFLVETAYDGWEAGKKVVQFKPTIIILDMTLPGLNGLDVCKDIRYHELTKNILIIAISGDLRYTETEVLKSGANAFFSRPVNFENLLLLSREFLEDPKPI
ncbi:MAG: PleD family two-component system response regulator [Nitrospinia bacterium]